MGATGYRLMYSLQGIIVSLCSYVHEFWAPAFIYFMLRISLDSQLEFFPTVLADCRRGALAYWEHPGLTFLRHKSIESGPQNGLYVFVACRCRSRPETIGNLFVYTAGLFMHIVEAFCCTFLRELGIGWGVSECVCLVCWRQRSG